MQTILAIILALAAAAFFFHRQRMKVKRAARFPQQLFAEVLPLLEDVELAAGEAIGTWKAQGQYRGHVFQIGVITDTLSVRKLPVLWLMLTLPEPQPLTQTFDLMMRATGPTTFSRFEFLPATLPMPPGFPEHALIRSELAGGYPADVVRPHLDWFIAARGKEILLSAKGLRLVLQAAEANRARYGVLRQAEFGDAVLDKAQVRSAMDKLLTMAEDLRQ